MNDADYTRHWDYANYIKKCKFGQAIFLKMDDDLEVMQMLDEVCIGVTLAKMS